MSSTKRKTNPSTRDELVPLPPLRRQRRAQPPPQGPSNLEQLVTWHSGRPRTQQPDQEKTAKALAIVHGTLAKERQTHVSNVTDISNPDMPVTSTTYIPAYRLNALTAVDKRTRQHARKMEAPIYVEGKTYHTLNINGVPSRQPRLIPSGPTVSVDASDFYRTLTGADVVDSRMLTVEMQPDYVTRDGTVEQGFPYKSRDRHKMTKNIYDPIDNRFKRETVITDRINRLMEIESEDADLRGQPAVLARIAQDFPRLTSVHSEEAYALRERMRRNLPQGQQP